MRNKQLRIVLVVALIIAVGVFALAGIPGKNLKAAPLQAVTTFFQMNIRTAASNAPILVVNQRFQPTGTTTATPPSNILQLQYNATPVWKVDYQGNLIIARGAVFATATASLTPTPTITPTATP